MNVLDSGGNLETEKRCVKYLWWIPRRIGSLWNPWRMIPTPGRKSM